MEAGRLSRRIFALKTWKHWALFIFSGVICFLYKWFFVLPGYLRKFES